MQLDKSDIKNGILASLAGTIALSAIMVMKQTMGLVPQMNPIADLAGVAHALVGLPNSALIGWALHFALGAFVWGTLFAVLHPNLPGPGLLKGVLFAVCAWFLMMLIFLPLTGQGLFGLNSGMTVPVMSYLLHLIYGAVLGVTFAKLSAN